MNTNGQSRGGPVRSRHPRGGETVLGTRKSASPAASILRISAGHHVSTAAVEHAREKIGRALDYASEPVLSARVRLARHSDRAADPVVAQASGSRIDSVLYRAEETGYLLAQVDPHPDEVTRGSVPMPKPRTSRDGCRDRR